ncbi:COG1361 S-layer family protein [Lachnoclostridium sp. Marseille-P6806]|uniref:COG1361 S-layer family protein n=1 Tax=Lachnoclostridium sp. Marseille-P6806 TaxID=2364793 RepID=UPI0035639E6B
MKQLKRRLAMCMAVMLMILAVPVPTFAAQVSITSDKIARGKTGKNMTVSFSIESSSKLEEIYIGFDVTGGEIWDETEEDMQYGYSFPFEVTGSLHDREKPKRVGTLDGKKSVSLSGRVRNDLTEGYYKVPVVVLRKVSEGGFEQLGYEDLQIWISKGTGTDNEDDENHTYDFVLGEGQSTPDGVYPNVMNFSINLRNNSPATVYNVKASMILDPDSTKFPFEINDANYDRMFEKIAVDETVSLDYSFAIREDTYTGYYPISMKIYYSDSSTGSELANYETKFYVRIHNKEKEDEYEEFNEHDRTKARLIIDGFATNPEMIVAGEAFELILNVKNASSSVPASDILMTVESEKASESPVFSTEAGSSSVSISSLGAGQSQEVRLRLSSRAGVDQRSYGLTFKAKYDSPEFKNAEETMNVDIPIRQIPRLNTGTFEIMPEAISVGEESNVMFGINNTGKVTLYNVMVKFEADSIQTTDTYVGNIKPGETGNVDCMVTGTAPTADEGKIKVTISYEDENGEISEEHKEMNLFVSDPMPAEDEMMGGGMDELPMEEPGFLEKYSSVLLPVSLGAVAVLTLILAGIAVRSRKRRKEQEEQEDDEL